MLIRDFKPERHKLLFKWAGQRTTISVKRLFTNITDNRVHGSNEVVLKRRQIMYGGYLDGRVVKKYLLEASGIPKSCIKTLNT